MFATFQYGASQVGSDDESFDFCSTNLPFLEERPTSKQLLKLEPTTRQSGGDLFAFTVSTKKA